MAIPVSVLGALVSVIGLVAIVKPESLVALVEHWRGL